MSKSGFLLVSRGPSNQGAAPGYDLLPSEEDDNGKGKRSGRGGNSRKLCWRLLLSLFFIVSVAGLGVALYGALKPVGLDEVPLILSDPPPSGPGDVRKKTVFGSAIRRPSWSPRSSILSATATIFALEYPEDLSDYVGQTYTVYSNTTLPHTVAFTAGANTRVQSRCSRSSPSSRPTWDQEGRYPVARFNGNVSGSFLRWMTPECGRIALIAQRGAQFCTSDLTECVTPLVPGANTTVPFLSSSIIIANLSTTDLSSLSAIFTNMTVSYANVDELTSVLAYIVTLFAETLHATTAHIINLVASNLQVTQTITTGGSITSGGSISAGGPITSDAEITSGGTVMGTQFMAGDILHHNASGNLPSSRARQTLQAPGGIVVAVNQISSLSVGPLVANAIVSSGETLQYKAVGSCWAVRDLANDAFTSASDLSGQRVIQLGNPEPVWGGDGTPGTGVECPAPSSVSSLTILSSGAAGTLTLLVRSSTELDYDFVSVRKNNQLLYSTSGAGPDENTNAFIEGVVVVAMTPSDVVTISYNPDNVWWGGYDIVYVQASFAASNSLSMTLPVAALASYVGKDIQVCSQDAGTHVVSFDPPSANFRFDPNGEWSVIQFQGNGQEACCVTLSVTTSDRVQVKTRDACTVFCDSLAQLHCVDPLRPYETNRIHGWWKNTVKTFREISYAFVDASRNPVSLVFHGGTVNNPKEAPSGSLAMNAVAILTYSSLTGTDIATDFSGYPTIVTIQPGFEKAVVYRGYDQDATDTGNAIFEVYEKQPGTSLVVPLVPTSTGTVTDRIPEDPVQMMRNYADYLLYAYFGSLNANDQWIGFLPAKALLEEIITTGKTHSHNISKTLVTFLGNPELLTEFRTADYHHVVPPARVVVSGFTGMCSVLNSEFEGFDMAVAGTTNSPIPNPLFEDYGPNPDQRTVHHKVTVFLDSSGVPTLADTVTADCPGSSPVISASYGPITSGTEYGPTVAAINYWFYEAMRIGYHVRPYLFFDPGSASFPSFVAYPIQTWADMVQLSALSTDMVPNAFKEKQIASRDSQTTSAFYSAPVLRSIRMNLEDSSLDRRGLQGTVDLMGRFLIRPDFDAIQVFETDNIERATYGYDIDIKNYLEGVAYPAWATVGTSRSAEVNLFAQIVSTTGGGDEFDTVMVPYGQFPPDQYSYVRQGAPLNYGSGPSSVYGTRLYTFQHLGEQQNFFVGRVKTSLTPGINSIGYIRMGDVTQFDTFRLSQDRGMCPTGMCSAPSYRNNAEALISIYATLMRYLRDDLGCSDVILDIRTNLGGSAIVPAKIAEFFGSLDRITLDDTWFSPSDNGNSPQVDLKTLFFSTGRLEASRDSMRVSPSTTESLYPGSVWQNAEFVFMTDTRAGSGGDIFPNCFLGGGSQTGNLGGGVQTHFLGSVDGRLTGYSGEFSVPFSRDSPRIRDPSGNARTPFRTNSEIGSGMRRIDESNLANRVEGLEIPFSGATGLAGGNPLWADWDELVYKDLGLSANGRPILAGWTGLPTPATAQGNSVSVVAGSNVVTIQTASPHGFNTGDDVAMGSRASPFLVLLGGLPGRVLMGGHIITVTSPTTFTFETSDQGTNYEGPEFIGSNFVGLGSGSIGPSTTFTSPVAASTENAGVTFTIMRRSDWRDAWLEQAIYRIITAPGLKKKSNTTAVGSISKGAVSKGAVRNKTTHQERRAARAANRAKLAKFDLEKANKLHGRNVGCVAGMNLTNPREMPSTINITFSTRTKGGSGSRYQTDDDEGHAHSLEAERVRNVVTVILKEELASGGMCLDSQGRLMATPSCKQNPRVVFADGDEKKRRPSCLGKKKAEMAKRASVKDGKSASVKHSSSSTVSMYTPLPEGTTYESCMAGCNTSFSNTASKDHRMCILRCKASFPGHVFYRPPVLQGLNQTAKKGSRC